MQKIKIGQTANATITVNKENTADTLGSGLLPVFSTPMLIALMEKAATEAIQAQLGEDETSVGTMINITHDAASPIAAKIIARATVTAIDRKRIDFEVSASDGKQIIGQGKHARFIVNAQKFMDKLK